MEPSNERQPDYPVAPDMQTPKRSLYQRLLAIFLIICVLLGGVFLARFLIKNKPKAKKRPPKKMETLVQVTPLVASDAALAIRAMGTVTATSLELKPRVAGTVIRLHPEFIRGDLLQEGEVLLELDPTDFRLALQRAQNSVQSAEMDLRIEEGGQAVAKREYELIREFSGTQVADAPEDLVLRQPQLAKARSAVAIAKTDLEKAELDLERTKVKVPFDALVLEKSAAIGAQVSTQTTVARLAEADVFYVEVALPYNQLNLFSLPGAEEKGASVAVRRVGAGKKHDERIWQGYVDSLLGQVEAGSLMAQLLVRIDKPLQQHPDQRLLLDSAVEVEIKGETIPGVFKIPRSAVRTDDTVLLAGKDDALVIAPVEIVWRDDQWIYVTAGLEEGQHLIVSPLAAPVAGMSLRVAGDGKGEKSGKDSGFLMQERNSRQK